jgi:hypothetical protein
VKAHILFKLTTRSRPIKAKASIDNIIEKCNSNDYTILVSIDEDDETMKNFDYKDDNVYIIRGKSKNKIDAINRDMNIFTHWDILINTSDDMVFNVKGFDEIIRQDFNGYYDQVLHYSDGFQKANIMTMSIMGIDYYNRFKYIYHPSYESLWCDVEATEVAWMLNKYKYMGDLKQLFTHMHPAWNMAQYDQQYIKTEAHEVKEKDLKTFIQRRSKNYNIQDHFIINKLTKFHV